MRLFLLLTLFTYIPSSWSNSNKEKKPTIKMGLWKSVPHIDNKNGKLSGPGYEWMQMLAEAADIHIEYIQVNIERGIKLLSENKIDTLAPLSKSKLRLQKMNFFAPAFLNYSYCIFSSKKDVQTWEDIKAYKGTVHYLSGFHIVPEVKNLNLYMRPVKGVSDTGRLVRLLKRSGQVAYLTSCEELVNSKKTPLGHFTHIRIPNGTTKLYFPYRKNLSPEIKARFEKGIKKLTTENPYLEYFYKRTKVYPKKVPK